MTEFTLLFADGSNKTLLDASHDYEDIARRYTKHPGKIMGAQGDSTARDTSYPAVIHVRFELPPTETHKGSTDRFRIFGRSTHLVVGDKVRTSYGWGEIVEEEENPLSAQSPYRLGIKHSKVTTDNARKVAIERSFDNRPMYFWINWDGSISAN